MLVEDTGVVLADPSDSEHNFKQLNELEGELPNLSSVSGLTEISVDGQSGTQMCIPQQSWAGSLSALFLSRKCLHRLIHLYISPA